MKTIWPKQVAAGERATVDRHHRAIVTFLSLNWYHLDSLSVGQRVELQALELLYSNAHQDAFGYEPPHLPTRRQDQSLFLIEPSQRPCKAVRRVV